MPDPKFYTGHDIYDFPHKQKKRILQMKLIGYLIAVLSVQEKMKGRTNRHMLMFALVLIMHSSLPLLRINVSLQAITSPNLQLTQRRKRRRVSRIFLHITHRDRVDNARGNFATLWYSGLFKPQGLTGTI